MTEHRAERHHYIPRFYQRGFTSDGEYLIWVYRRGQPPSLEAIKDVGMDWDFYTFVDNLGQLDDSTEHDHLQRIDNDGAIVIRHLADSFVPGAPLNLSAGQRKRLSAFVATMYSRSPANRARVEALAPKVIAAQFDEMLAELEAATSDDPELAESEMLTGVTVAEAKERIIPSVLTLREAYEADPPIGYLFASQIQRHGALYKVLKDMDFVVFRASDGTEFITGDGPALWDSRRGLAHPDALVLMPLSKDLLLQASNRVHWRNTFKVITPAEARGFNRQLAAHSNSFVLASRDDHGIRRLVENRLGDAQRRAARESARA